MLILVVVYTGDLATADEVVQPLAALGRPLADLVTKTTWVQANSMLDAVAPYGMRMNLRGGYLPALSGDAIDVLLEHVATVPAKPGDIYSINISFMGGAISEDADEDAMAFSRAGAAWLWEAICKWDAPEADARYDDWATTLTEAMQPHALTNGYANLTDDLGEEWRRGVHGSDAKHQRLRSVKAAWDPRNLLRFNKNITPGTAG
ncbi:BBE domain-containing protein [Streptomyces chiangmaiensis]